jgi:DNA-binding NarL/FixJ family response regulator
MAEELMRASPLEAGWAALSGGDWERARASFEESLAEGETPEALEGLGWAGHMLNEDRLTFDSRERAYRLYLGRDDKSSAARIAALLAADCLLFRGEAAIASGWLQRSHSLIDDIEPGIDHGWLAIHEGHIAVSLDEDTAKARQLAARAVELGRRFGAPELEMLGLGLEGRALVSEGELEEGMRRLDEDALDLLASSDARFETARARLDLGAALSALGRSDQARREIEAALSDFQEMGADGECARALTMLGKLRATRATLPEAAVDSPLGGLSKRELEVLGLVAEGLTNHEIAERLVLSEHTVNRHVANILRKLGLPSRAAAASLAGRYGLV